MVLNITLILYDYSKSLCSSSELILANVKSPGSFFYFLDLKYKLI